MKLQTRVMMKDLVVVAISLPYLILVPIMATSVPRYRMN